MAKKFDLITALYEEEQKLIVRSPESWKSFLSSACRNYKLRFDDLILVYAQRPDATAVLEIEKWNNNFGRWVNTGAKGIAVFDDVKSGSQRLKHYFDISDTHETKYSRPVPLWVMRDEYIPQVIETLENTFGELENKDTLIDAILSAADIAVDDNIPDYTSDLLTVTENSFLEELDDISIASKYENTVKNSIAYMIASRLGLDADAIFEREDFEDIVNFNTTDTLNALGYATSDISEMALSEIAKTVFSLEKENRTIDKTVVPEYTKDKIETERSVHNGRNQLQNSRSGTASELGTSEKQEPQPQQMGREAPTVSQGESPSDLLQPDDEGQARQSSPGGTGESREDGGTASQPDGSTGGLDGAAQGSGYDGLGTGYEQPEDESSGDSSQRGDLQLTEPDELPPFTDEARIMTLLMNNDNSLVHRKEFIVEQHGKLKPDEFARYTSTIYGGRLKQYNIDGVECGFEHLTDGLLMYEGNYRNRTKESVFSWGVIGELISQLIENGEYLPPAKEEMEKPESEQLQLGLFDLDDNFTNEVVEFEDSQVSLFPRAEIPQQIIDEAICLGTHDKESKLKITAYLRKDKPIDDNAAFIKNEYKEFASGFVFEGDKISVLADDEGLRIDMDDTARFHSATAISWNDVAKRTRELLDLGRYMPQYQLDKVDVFERTKIAEHLAFMTRDIREEYIGTYMTFVKDILDNYRVFPDIDNALAERLNNPDDLATVIDDLIVYINALNENKNINRFPKLYQPQLLLNRLYDLQLPQLEFKAQAGVPEVPSRFISEDEINWLLRKGSSDTRLWYYSLYKTQPDANARITAIKDHHGLSGSYNGVSNISADGKGYTLSRGNIMEPYAKITLKWNDVEKRIGKMIALDTFLTDKDKAYIPTYEKKQLAFSLRSFFFGVSDDYQKSYDYDNDSEVASQLDNPEAVETIYNEMLTVIRDMKEDDRLYEYSHKVFANFSQFREGTFSLFGEKKESKSLPAKEESAEPEVTELLSPFYREYLRVESENIGNLVFFQVGDFYEALGDGARIVADELDLILTGRDVGKADRIPMCGFPVSSLDRYLKRLTSRGYKVTISDLIENGDRIETTYTIDSDKIPVGRIDFYAMNGQIREFKDYISEEEFLKDIADCNYAGEPIGIVVYSDKNGKKISTKFAQDLDPMPLGFETVPYDEAMLDRAKGLIKKYLETEFGQYDEKDYTDLQEIGLAFTETEDGKHTIEAFADIVNDYAITILYDGAVFDKRSYPSLSELIDNELYGLDFMELTYLDDDKLKAFEKRNNEVVEALPESTVSDNEFDIVGKELELDGRKFVVESVDGHDAHLRDITFQQQVGFPIGRAEPKERIIELLKQAEKDSVLPPPKTMPMSRVPTFDLHPEIPMDERHNFNLRDFEVESVGKKERFKRNMAAITVLKECEFDNRFATPEEQKILAQYVGWGGMPEAFDEDNVAWADEYKELIVALSPDEYERARESTLTAFYTPPVVIDAIYKVMAQLGYKNGNLLEPSCGIGNFIGMLPNSMSDSRVYGVELDTISAGIAKQLYQKSSIAAMPFENANIPDSFFDGVIGNIPFGDFKVVDKRYDKHNFLIHDYFFAKSIDKLRTGGVIALVTSKGTMDKENSNVRKYIAQRADLLGAIRLPDNTFKGNAGTEVTSDILILQKRDRMVDIEPDWVQLDTDDNGIRMNKYFVDHPEMIMGEMVMKSGRFGMESTCKAYENTELSDLLAEAISNIHGEIPEIEMTDEIEDDMKILPADPSVRNFSYTVVDGEIYFRENSYMKPVEVSATAENRIKGMIGIRDSVRSLIEMQTENYPDEYIEAEQKKLNTLYDDFTKKYGLINSRANSSAFSDDSSYFLLTALEIVEDGKLIRKADMFTKRTIQPHIPITHADTASDALAISIGEKATIDMTYMKELTGKTEDELFNDLQGVIYLNPLQDNPNEDKYLMADEYLSGNVREKLKTAKQMAEVYPEYKANVEALERIQPKDLTASEISVRLGATWLPPDVIKDFIFELLNPAYYKRYYIKVHYSEHTGEWNIEGKSADRGNIKAETTYGTKRVNAYKIIETTLNLKDVRVFDYVDDADGKRKAVLNQKETQIAQAKQEQIKQEFKDWIWKDPERRDKLCKMYNERFNSLRPREYDGSHITFHGMNPEISLRPHQLNAIAHSIYGGNTLLAHAVGAGKTFEMVAIAQESKYLGLCNKSMFVVPNHLVEQLASEYLQLYPSANILVATKKDFETKNRKKFCGRIATGDYDAVIIGHSQFEKIPMSIERQVQVLQEQLDDIVEGIQELQRSGGEKFSIKQLERSKKSITNKLKKLNDQERKDDVVTFEELGVDKIFVDEAHYFKNLFLYTKMRNVGGIGQSEAQKSSDLFMKCRYLDDITGGKGIVFATGTPISNSMVELYTMQRYLQYETLREHHLQHFDAWASTFGETVTTIELKPEGTGYRAKTRFAHFYNLPELMSMFKEIADIQTADMLDLPVPTAHYENVAVKPSELQREMVESLSERAEIVRGGSVDPTEDNMLKITNDGRKLALEQRLINPLLPDNEGSKVNACVDNIYRYWEEGAEKKLTQLVFCDLSTPKAQGEGDEFTDVYNDIRKKLITKGVPENEIAFMHNADTEVKKKELFAKVRKGDVRVLLGSTQKMGAGTNVQDKLIAIHDIDCPWRPADLEQRAGRIIRQGNQNPDVYIHRYVTENTFDAYLYQIIENKQKFISQIMTSKSPVRSAEDVDEAALSYAEIKMLATGDPHIKEKMDLDMQVSKLKMLKSSFLSEKYALEDKVIKFYPAEIARFTAQIKGYEEDIQTAQKHPKGTAEQFCGMVIFGKLYEDKKEAGLALVNACKAVTSNETIPLGEYRGFKLDLLYDSFGREYKVNIKGAITHTAELGTDALGNITRLDNAIDSFEKQMSMTEERLKETKVQYENAKLDAQKEFPQEEELRQKLERLNELNSSLQLDERVNQVIDDSDLSVDDEEPERKSKEQVR